MAKLRDTSRDGSNPIQLVFAIDRNYVMPLAACVGSILENKSEDDFLDIYIICSQVPQYEKDRLQASWSTPSGVRIHYIDHDISLTDAIHIPKSAWSSSNLLPLFLTHYLPRLSRVIFLDADTLTFGSLQPLFATDLAGKGIGAVIDPYTKTLGGLGGVQVADDDLDRDLPYFNTGVMLLDLDYWSCHGVEAAAIDYLRQHGKTVVGMEQEALNWHFRGNFIHLHSKWNVMNFWDEEERRLDLKPEASDRMVIRHFESSRKPWKSLKPMTKIQESFFHYLDQTDWRGWRPPHLWRRS